jgi:hypothetical protein
MDDDNHYLSEFLCERLPALGLDYETYGPYVVGAAGSETMDEEELDAVLELLQASSESHGDDASEWQQLKMEIQQRQQKYQQERQEALVKQREALHRQEQERLQHEIELAKNQPVEKKSKHLNEMDAQKRALVERFAYEQEENDDDEEEEEGEAVISNKDVAAQANLEKAREQRQSQKSTKKQEQEATKQAKLQKSKIKEERRKRAQKSERKR